MEKQYSLLQLTDWAELPCVSEERGSLCYSVAQEGTLPVGTRGFSLGRSVRFTDLVMAWRGSDGEIVGVLAEWGIQRGLA